MEIERLSFVLPVDDLPAAAAEWAALLGVRPTFVDGDRWAQFDLAGARLSLAGTDRASDSAGLMVKVGDVEAARAEVVRGTYEAADPERGPHEIRCLVDGPGGTPVVLYGPVGR